ncbi:MAG TPA: NAD-dependent epimerase/dehydratase family protein, partial [Chloroflexota bacterium]
MTGGAGFIGSHVVDALLEAGHRVLAVDNLATGRRRNVNPAAEFVEVDLRDGDLEAILADYRPEVVLHEAAQASVPGSVHDPLYDLGVNVVGTVRLLEAARKSGTRKIIYAATGGAM